MTDVASRRLARRRWTLIGAVAVAVAVVGIVLAFGVVPYPSPPRLADQPEPLVGARLAYVTHDDGACLRVVDDRGDDRELGCGSTYEGELQRLDDARLGISSFRHPDPVIHVIDPETGAVIDTVDAPTDAPAAGLEQENVSGEVARTGEGDGTVWVEVTDPDGATTRVLELDAPDSYGLYRAGWTPDEEWIVVLDSLRRALVVPADGDGTVRIWAEDVGGDAIALP